MTRDDVVAKLHDIFCDIFEEDQINITETMTANDVKNWDSLNHVHMILEVEDQFKFQFDVGQASQIENVGALIDLIIANSPKT